MDTRFTADFFQPAQVLAASDLRVDFPLPADVADMPTFLAMGKSSGREFRAGVKKLMHQVSAWIEKAWQNEPLVVQTYKNTIESFIGKFEYKGNALGYNQRIFAAYHYGFAYLKAVLTLLDSPATHIDTRKLIVQMLLMDLDKCLPGFYSRVTTAHDQLRANPQAVLMGIRRAVAEEIALNLIRSKKILIESIGNEIHLVNSIINHTALLFGIEKKEDAYAINVAEDQRENALVLTLREVTMAFELAFTATFTVEIAINYLIQRLLPCLLAILHSNQTQDEKNTQVDTLLIPYGVDPYFNQYTFFDPETYELRCSFDLELQLTLSLLERFKRSHLIKIEMNTHALKPNITLHHSKQLASDLHYILITEKSLVSRTDVMSYLLENFLEDEANNCLNLFFEQRNAAFVSAFFTLLEAKKAYLDPEAVCNIFIESPEGSHLLKLVSMLDAKSLMIFLKYVDENELKRYFHLSMDKASSLALFQQLDLHLDDSTDIAILHKLLNPLFHYFGNDFNDARKCFTRSKHSVLQILVCSFENDKLEMDTPEHKLLTHLYVKAKNVDREQAQGIALKRGNFFLAREIFKVTLTEIIAYAAKKNYWPKLRTILLGEKHYDWLGTILTVFSIRGDYDFYSHLASLLTFYNETEEAHQVSSRTPKSIRILGSSARHISSIIELLSKGHIPKHHHLDFSSFAFSDVQTSTLLKALATASASTHVGLTLNFANLNHDVFLIRNFIDRGECPQGLQLHFFNNSIYTSTLNEIAALIARSRTPKGFGIHFPQYLPHGSVLDLMGFVIEKLHTHPGPENLLLDFSNNPLNHAAIDMLSTFICSGSAPKGLRVKLQGMQLETIAFTRLTQAIFSANAPSHLMLDISGNTFTDEHAALFKKMLLSGKAPAFFYCEFPKRDRRLMKPIEELKHLIEDYAFYQIEQVYLQQPHFMDLTAEEHDRLALFVTTSPFSSAHLKMKWLTERYTTGFLEEGVSVEKKALAQSDFYNMTNDVLEAPDDDPSTTYYLATKQLNLLATLKEWEKLHQQVSEIKPNVMRLRLFGRSSLLEKFNLVLQPDFFTVHKIETKLRLLRYCIDSSDINSNVKLKNLFESIHQVTTQLCHLQHVPLLEANALPNVTNS